MVIIQEHNSTDTDKYIPMSKVDPSKLYGIEVFWKIVQEASDKEVMEKSRDFLNRIYTQFTSDIDIAEVKKSFVESCLDRLAKTIDDPDALEKGTLSKMIKLIEDTIVESERRGTGGVRSHISIAKRDIINIRVKNEITSGEGIPKEMEVETLGNVNMWDLKLETAKYVEANPECIKLCLDYTTIKETDHGKILSELEKSSFGTLAAERKDFSEAAFEPLLNEDKTLTELAKRAFADIFKKYSVDGKMSMHKAADFLGSIMDQKDFTPNSKIVKQMFKNFDKDRDNYLTLEDIEEFYKDFLTNDKAKLVRKHLHTNGFRYDLKKINEIPLYKVNAAILPRVLLSQNVRSYELLFKALDQWGSKVYFAWHLICRLCTNEEMYMKIKDIDKKVVWDDIINTKSSFRLLYCLQIIAGLFRSEELKEWKQLFVTKGGFSFLVDLLLSKDLNVDFKTMERYDKITLIALIKTINMFIEIAIYVLNKELPESYTEYLKLTQYEPSKVNKEERDALLKLFNDKPSDIFFPRGHHKKPEAIPSLVFSEEQATVILDNVLSKELWKRQLNILADLFWNRPQLSAEDIKLGSVLICMMSLNLSFNSSIFSLYKTYTYEDKDFDSLLLFGLMQIDSTSIRVITGIKLYLQCFLYKNNTEENNVLNYIMRLLLRAIIEKTVPQEKPEEFFKLFGNLVDVYYKGKNVVKRFDIGKLMDELTKTLKEEIAAENRDSMMLAVGVIETIVKILEYEPLLKETFAIKGGMLNELYTNLLFTSKENHYDSKPGGKKCLESAFKLILTLCKDNPKIQSILYLDYLDPLLEKIEPSSSWAHDPADESRSRFDYIGIRNLGCICYMISILQQFYMVPPFRYGLLSVESEVGEAPEEDLLYQLKLMFASLECSQREAYNPKAFCNAFKDLDGNPTSTSVQQDAHEFLNMSFERMENLIAGTPQRYLINGIFGGRVCIQLICKGGCGNIRQHYEDFFSLSLEVKGFKTLFESLNKFVAGDKISDYMCAHCNKKVDVLKRTTLSDLPNVLIIHLQRFVFNYDTLRNDKINSLLEFPKEFSMKPYTVEGIIKKDDSGEELRDDSYFHYKLAGVVVHRGYADAGHYYSFINTNRKSKLFMVILLEFKDDTEHNLFKADKDLWLEFNDSKIISFE